MSKINSKSIKKLNSKKNVKMNNPVVKRVIRLNINLFPALGRVLGMSNTELMEATGIKNATWYRIMGHPDEITVQQLISIANRLCIPVRRFFLYDETNMVGIKDDYIENPYKPCHYDTKNLIHLIDTRAVATWQDVADTLGITRSNLRNSLLLATRLPLGRFLRACEYFGIDPFCVIIDPNPLRVDQRERMNLLATKQEYATIQHDISIIQRELAVFRAEIMNVRRDIARLDKKIDMFIDAHYEEITDPDEAVHTPVLTRQIVKEIQGRADKELEMTNNTKKEA